VILGSVPPIPEPLDRILPALIDDLRVSLGPDLVGAYLYGSAVEGGFDPKLSDLDLAVVTAPNTDDIPFERFAGVVGRLQKGEPDWAGRLELTFVGRRTLADFPAGGAFVEISHSRALQRLPDAGDWIETWFLVRHADRPLLGPPAGDLFPRIDIDAFLEAVVDGIDGFIAPALRDDAASGSVAYRVVTLCRLLRSLETRTLSTKQEGVGWAVDRYPEWAPLINVAMAVRASAKRRGLNVEEVAAIRQLLLFLAREVHRAAP
jgi:hypothetical protein